MRKKQGRAARPARDEEEKASQRTRGLTTLEYIILGLLSLRRGPVTASSA